MVRVATVAAIELVLAESAKLEMTITMMTLIILAAEDLVKTEEATRRNKGRSIIWANGVRLSMRLFKVWEPPTKQSGIYKISLHRIWMILESWKIPKTALGSWRKNVWKRTRRLR